MDPAAPMMSSTMCPRCGDNQQLAPLRDDNDFVSHINFQTGKPCPGAPRAPYNPPITIDRRTRIKLAEMPGVVFILAGLATSPRDTAELHLVEENEWRRRRIANGLPVDLAPGE